MMKVIILSTVGPQMFMNLVVIGEESDDDVEKIIYLLLIANNWAQRSNFGQAAELCSTGLSNICLQSLVKRLQYYNMVLLSW